MEILSLTAQASQAFSDFRLTEFPILPQNEEAPSCKHERKESNEQRAD